MNPETELAETAKDLERITTALQGLKGEDQFRIAQTVVSFGALLLRKNQDYGSSVWQVPVLAPESSVATAIRVRMSDKISRINNLLKSKTTPEINESLEDTIKDLGAYCLLLLAAPTNDPPTSDT
jgi:hypothetical protein